MNCTGWRATSCRPLDQQQPTLQ